MRDIRVRVFDLDGGKMSAGFNLEACIAGDEDIEFPDTDESLPWTDFIVFRKEYSDLMLFIGIRDKTGKEIFQRDILKSGNGKWVGLVEYHAPEYKFNDGKSLFSVPFETFEVVTNVYEAPGLALRITGKS